MFYVRFFLAWIGWFLFADKSRWRELVPVSIFAGFLGLTTDVLVLFYPLWVYHDSEGDQHIANYLLDDWGLYFVTTYLFIQWMPRRKTFWKMFGYWFLWTGFSIFIEWLHLRKGLMDHHYWWALRYSYLSGWVLFWIFYQYHKIFGLEQLNKKNEDH